ncbi:9921_t:CDS:2, partial [Racocetra fulgida]
NRRYDELENKLFEDQERTKILNLKLEEVHLERNDERHLATNLRNKIIDLENKNRELRSKLLSCGCGHFLNLALHTRLKHKTTTGKYAALVERTRNLYKNNKKNIIDLLLRQGEIHDLTSENDEEIENIDVAESPDLKRGEQTKTKGKERENELRRESPTNEDDDGEPDLKEMRSEKVLRSESPTNENVCINVKGVKKRLFKDINVEGDGLE